VFIVIYRTTDGRRQLRKFTLGTYGALTLVMARAAAQKVLLARLDGKDPAAEKQEKRRRPLGLSV
jgi:Arm DNA-binding domain